MFDTCLVCNKPITQHDGAGRPKLYCGRNCINKASIVRTMSMATIARIRGMKANNDRT
jgi:hypothetical protein